MALGGNTVVWTGKAGRGKTIAAVQLVQLVTSRTDNPHACRYILVAGTDSHRGTAHQASGIRLVYHQIVGSLSSSAARNLAPMRMAEDIVNHCAAAGTRLLIIDEAGALSSEQLRGITMIADHASLHAVPLTVLLIGMGGLAAKTSALPQLARRVFRACEFGDWPEADQRALVLAHTPSLMDPAAHRFLPQALDHLIALAAGDVSFLHKVCMIGQAGPLPDDPTELPLHLVAIADELRPASVRGESAA